MNFAKKLGTPHETGPSLVRDASYAQERLWLHDTRNPSQVAHNLAFCFRITGRLDLGIFERALAFLVSRHGGLRTTFHEEKGHVYQTVASHADVSLEILDCNPGEVDEYLDPEECNAAKNPFFLSRGPLFRNRVYRIGSDEFLWIFVVHHIVFDGWSATVFFDELAHAYNHVRSTASDPEWEPAAQFHEFSDWQRSLCATAEGQALLSYWRGRLAAPRPRLRLPHYPADIPSGFAGGTLDFGIERSVVAEIKRLGSSLQSTLFCMGLSALILTMHVASGQTDISIGFPVSSRTRSPWEGVVGYLADTHVIRVLVSAQQTICQLINEVTSHVIGALEHQDMPIPFLMSKLQPAHGMHYEPIYNIRYAVLNVPPHRSLWEGLTVAPFTPLRPSGKEARPGSSTRDISLYLAEESGNLRARLEFNSLLIDRKSACRIVSLYQRIFVMLPSLMDSKVRDKRPEWHRFLFVPGAQIESSQ